MSIFLWHVLPGIFYGCVRDVSRSYNVTAHYWLLVRYYKAQSFPVTMHLLSDSLAVCAALVSVSISIDTDQILPKNHKTTAVVLKLSYHNV